MSNDTVKSDVLSRMRSYDPPPIGFDPRTASEDLLRHHGLPRRPDPTKEPGLAKMWELAFSRPLNYIKAELAINPAIKRSQRKQNAEFGQSGWAGAIRKQQPYHEGFEGDPRIINVNVLGQPPKSDYSLPATAVSAQFQVPEVLPPQVSEDTTSIGFWVGLDGYVDDGPLQAGIQAIVSGKNVTYSAWFEWYTNEIPAMSQGATVLNLPVRPRDAVCVAVSTVQPDYGMASILNITTRQMTTVGIQAPANATSLGMTAEWIVEANSDPPSPYLPYFTPVIFTGCTGQSADGNFHVEPDAQLVNILDTQTDFQPITQTFVEASVVIVEWLAEG